MEVTVYFVVRGNKCELATIRKSEADIWIDGFNKFRRENGQLALIKTKTIVIN